MQRVCNDIPAVRHFLKLAATQCASGLPALEVAHGLAVLVQPMQALWGLDAHQLRTSDDNKDLSCSTMWRNFEKADIGQHVVTLLNAFKSRLSPRTGGGGSGHGGSSSSSGAAGVRNDRAAAAAKALALLKERRLQAEPYSFLLLSLVSSSMGILVSLFSTVGPSSGGIVAEQLLSREHIFERIDSVMHYLLRCTREGGMTKGPPPAPFRADTNPQLTATINCCAAACQLLTAIKCLPPREQLRLVSNLPSRFVDTLCCLAVEGLAGLVPCPLEAQHTLLLLATLPNHLHVRCILDCKLQPVSNDAARAATGFLTQALRTPHFARLVCRVLVLVVPSALPNKDGPPIPQPSRPATPPLDRKARTKVLEDLFCLVPTMYNLFLERRAKPACDVDDWATRCHTVLVEGAASSGLGSGGPDGVARVDGSGAWAMHAPPVGLAAVVRGVCRVGAHCAGLGYLRPEHAHAAEVSLHLVLLLLELERGESEERSAFAPEAVQLRKCVPAAARLAAALGRVVCNLSPPEPSELGLVPPEGDSHRLEQDACRQRTEEREGARRLELGVAQVSFRMLELCSSRVDAQPDRVEGLRKYFCE